MFRNRFLHLLRKSPRGTKGMGVGKKEKNQEKNEWGGFGNTRRPYWETGIYKTHVTNFHFRVVSRFLPDGITHIKSVLCLFFEKKTVPNPKSRLLSWKARSPQATSVNIIWICNYPFLVHRLTQTITPINCYIEKCVDVAVMSWLTVDWSMCVLMWAGKCKHMCRL